MQIKLTTITVMIAISSGAAFGAVQLPWNMDSTAGDATYDMNTDVPLNLSGSPIPSLNTDDPFGLDYSNSMSFAPGSWKRGVSPALSSLSYASAGQVTLETWVKPIADGAIDRIAQITNITGTTTEIFLERNADNTLKWRFYAQGAGTSDIDESVVIPTNTWTHIALAIRWGEAVIYVNGSAIATYNQTSGIGDLSRIMDDSSNLRLSAGSMWSSTGYLMDDLRVSGEFLDAAELGYHESFSIPEPGSCILLLTGLGFFATSRRRREALTPVKH